MEAIEIQQHEIAEIEDFAVKRDNMLDEIRKVIVGQDQVIEEVLIALFARGHCLLVGVPGLAKTLLISTLAEILDLDFNRIQFTPDLMPSDITGTDILQEDEDRKSTRLNSSHSQISYAVFCLKKKTLAIHDDERTQHAEPQPTDGNK